MLDKVVYLQNRRFLPEEHSLRKAKKNFPGEKSCQQPPPSKLTNEDIQFDSIAYENCKNPTQASLVTKATGSKGCNSFMLLPYHDRTIQVFPDMMHLLKNVVQELVDVIIGRSDGIKVRKTEEHFGRFPGCSPGGVQENMGSEVEQQQDAPGNSKGTCIYEYINYYWTLVCFRDIMIIFIMIVSTVLYVYKADSVKL